MTIKPFQILSVRDEADGGKTVFFRARRTVQITDTNSSTKTMQTATYVRPDQDIDDHIFNILQEAGWV